MKIASVWVRDILGEEADTPLEARHYVRFQDDHNNWIDVELRDGEVTVRGSSTLTIKPNSGNQISIDLTRLLR